MYNFVRNYAQEYHDIWQSCLNQYVQADFRNTLVQFLNKEYKIRYNQANAISESLLARMSDMDLYYHNPIHVLSMLSWAEGQQIGLRKPVELAIWFHDAIYDPKAAKGTNEDNSIHFMMGLLKGYVPQKELAEAMFMIQMTGDHFAEDAMTSDAALLMDIDLCCFAWDHKNFLASTKAIEMEFSFYNKEDFRHGRTKLLKTFLGKKEIYRTPWLKDKFETRARANLMKSIHQLESPENYGIKL